MLQTCHPILHVQTVKVRFQWGTEEQRQDDPKAGWSSGRSPEHQAASSVVGSRTGGQVYRDAAAESALIQAVHSR